jgi:hypothetical protein
MTMGDSATNAAIALWYLLMYEGKNKKAKKRALQL